MKMGVPMTEPNESVIAWIKAALIAVPVIGAAFWGGLGGATNALVIRVTLREALRHVAIGAVIAAGLGGLAAPIMTHWLGLPSGMLTGPLAAGGSISYLTGSLGAAIFEAMLSLIRSGKLPNDKAP